MIRPVVSFAFMLLRPGLLAAAPDPILRAEPAVPASIAPAGSPGAKEQAVLKKLGSMTAGQISELMEVYARTGNRRMSTALSEALLKRDPANQNARELARSVLSDGNGTPDDPIARKADELMIQGQPAAAAGALAQLKSTRYPSGIFPWQEDLAYALHDAGRVPEARAAFEEILRTPGYCADSRAGAQKAVHLILVDTLAKEGDTALKNQESERALRLAEQLLAATPGDPDAVALKAGALTASGQPRRAVEYLLTLKPPAPVPNPHALALGTAYQAALMPEDAQAAWQGILADSTAPPALQGEARQQLADLARDTRITAGHHALRKGQMTTVDLILTELETTASGHPDTNSFKAAVQIKRRQYTRARATLEQLRNHAEARREFFDARESLAEALAATGSIRAAAAEYHRVMEEPKYDTATRYEAARRHMELERRLKPGFNQQVEATTEAEGKRLSSTTELSTGEIWESGNVLLIRTAWDTVELDQTRLLRIQENDRFEAEAAWRYHWQQGFFGEVSAGGSTREVLYGAALGRYAQPGGTAWELSFRANDRAMDSLHLVALDGRQTQIALTAQHDLTDRFSVDGTLRYRWLDVQGSDLGQGINLNFNAGYTLLPETPGRPELALSYQGAIQHFARKNFSPEFCDGLVRRVMRGNSRLEESLIEEEINRHAVILTLSKKFSPRFSGCVYGGIAREFENDQNEGLGGAGLEAFIGPRTALFFNLDYSTSGRAGSRGSEVWTAYAGARVLF